MIEEIDSQSDLDNNRDIPIGTFESSTPAEVHGGHNRTTNNGISHNPNISLTMQHRDYEINVDLPSPLTRRVRDEKHDPIFDIDYDNRILSIYAKLVTIEAVDYKTMIKNNTSKEDENTTSIVNENRIVSDTANIQIMTENRKSVTTNTEAITENKKSSTTTIEASDLYIKADTYSHQVTGYTTFTSITFKFNGNIIFANDISGEDATFNGYINSFNWPHNGYNNLNNAISDLQNSLSNISTNLNVSLQNLQNLLEGQISDIQNRLSNLENP